MCTSDLFLSAGSFHDVLNRVPVRRIDGSDADWDPRGIWTATKDRPFSFVCLWHAGTMSGFMTNNSRGIVHNHQGWNTGSSALPERGRDFSREEKSVSRHNYRETVQMNVDAVIRKKGWNGVGSGCTTINVNSKKFPTKGAPDAVVKLTGEQVFSQGNPFSTILCLFCSFFPAL